MERLAIWQVPAEQRRALWRVSGYSPSAEQWEAHIAKNRVKLVMGGERGGKSRFTAEELLIWGLVSDAKDFFWIVGPDYYLSRPEIEHLMTSADAMGMLDTKSVSMPQEGVWTCRLRTGVVYQTRTSADVQKLAGKAPTGVAMVEAGQQPYESYLRLRGRVAEARGPLVLSGTMESTERWYPDLFSRWKAPNIEGGMSFSLPTWSNTAIFPEGRQDPEILALEAAFPADVFQERFGAVPCKSPELVFPEFDYTVHVDEYPYQPGVPVRLWVDPGYASAYAVVVVQIIGENVYQIDEVYGVRKTAQEVITECQERPWWGDVVSPGVIDLAGRQHQGMDSHEEIWLKEAGLHMVSQPVGIPDGILRHRTFLMNPGTKKPRLYHHHTCEHTIREYGLYKYRRGLDGRPVREDPIDANNHAMKALAYGLVASFGYVPGVSRKVRVKFRKR